MHTDNQAAASLEAAYRPELVAQGSHLAVLLTGCSGGGKSSLLAELAWRGFAVREEPGRQVVKEQLFIGGDALPWLDLEMFVELTVSRSLNHLVEAVRAQRLTFCDRGIIDQIAGLEHAGLAVPEHLARASERCRYNDIVFVLPPWREIFTADAERRHGFEEAVASYETLVAVYRRLRYTHVEVPKLAAAERADFVLATLHARAPELL